MAGNNYGPLSRGLQPRGKSVMDIDAPDETANAKIRGLIDVITSIPGIELAPLKAFVSGKAALGGLGMIKRVNDNTVQRAIETVKNRYGTAIPTPYQVGRELQAVPLTESNRAVTWPGQDVEYVTVNTDRIAPEFKGTERGIPTDYYPPNRMQKTIHGRTIGEINESAKRNVAKFGGADPNNLPIDFNHWNDWDELLKRYPELAKIGVTFAPMDDAWGRYYSRANKIELNPEILTSGPKYQKQLWSTLNHELGHATMSNYFDRHIPDYYHASDIMPVFEDFTKLSGVKPEDMFQGIRETQAALNAPFNVSLGNGRSKNAYLMHPDSRASMELLAKMTKNPDEKALKNIIWNRNLEEHLAMGAEGTNRSTIRDILGGMANRQFLTDNNFPSALNHYRDWLKMNGPIRKDNDIHNMLIDTADWIHPDTIERGRKMAERPTSVRGISKQDIKDLMDNPYHLEQPNEYIQVLQELGIPIYKE